MEREGERLIDVKELAYVIAGSQTFRTGQKARRIDVAVVVLKADCR